MPGTIELEKRAKAALRKPSPLGEDIDLSEFDASPTEHPYMEETEIWSMPEEEKERLIMAGLDPEGKNRGGTYFQKDTSVIHCGSKAEGVDVLPVRKAVETEEWLKKYYWQLVPVDMDKYTASAALDLHDGYVIRARAGAKGIYPVQACLYTDKSGLQQNVHNVIVVEEGAELHIINGCTTSPGMKGGLHVGVSEFYVHKNASLSFTMIHNWAEDMYVRPRTVVHVEEGGHFTNNYICMKPVNDLQMYPSVYLKGEGSVARLYSIILGSPGSEYDIGGRAYLKAPNSRVEIISRAISNGGRIIPRGHLVGEVPDIKAHLECRGLILNGGMIHAIPELQGFADGVEMSHEAAVGKIAQDEIHYLMSRGLSEDEATSVIIRGFLSLDIPELPEELQEQIDRAVETSDTKAM
jgi:hypothetical protein